MRAGVDRSVAGLEHASSEARLVLLVVAADDIEADHVIRQIDEQAYAVLELLDDERAVVGVRVVPVFLLELGRGHQVPAQLRRVARTGQLRADHIFVFRIAIEQEAIRPDDVIACKRTLWIIRHSAAIVPPTLGL